MSKSGYTEEEWKILSKYLPEKAFPLVKELIEAHPVHLTITPKRITKHGDFKGFPGGMGKITVNGMPNTYRFLITLIHEYAHYLLFKRYNRHYSPPHGPLWKEEMRRLMLPFLNNDIFPNDILPYLAQYLLNPKATTGSDPGLSSALRKYDPRDDKVCIFELSEGDRFVLNDQAYKLGKKRRTRYLCKRLSDGKDFLVHGNAEVWKIESKRKGK